MLARSRIIFTAVSLAVGVLALSLSKGSTSVPVYQLFFNENSEINTIILQLRLPRTLTAFTCGGLLALAGSLMQLLLQNPLADPYVLGTSGGAALGILLLILLGANADWIIVGAWSGSLISIILVFLLARKHRWQTHTLLLTGIALACGFSACISFILLISPASHLHDMLFWLTGNLNDARFPWLGLTVLGIGLATCLVLAPGLNILARGEKSARTLGLPSTTYRIGLFLISSLFTATAVTLAGCIGFIGLIVPHLTRLLCGHDHRIILPLSTLLGGSLLTLADTCARTFFTPQQIPVGIIMALIGVPVFVWLLGSLHHT